MGKVIAENWGIPRSIPVRHIICSTLRRPLHHSLNHPPNHMMRHFHSPFKTWVLAGLLLCGSAVMIAAAAPRAETSAFSAVRVTNPLISSINFAAIESQPASTPATSLTREFKGHLPITELTQEEAILHALNRLGYGPRPGDIERVRKMGLEKWIQLQLRPERIDDSALAARLEDYPTQKMSISDLTDQYPTPQIAAKRLHISVEEYNRRIAESAKNQDSRGAASKLPQRIVDELAMAKLTRAIYSDRQLNERLLDFWFNHFNVFIYKDNERYLVPSYERDVLRPHLLGKFADLLSATAQSPAMLRYLDNWLSADPTAFERLKHPPTQRRGQRSPKAAPRTTQPAPKPAVPLGGKRGLNENYGRELLELHTLGVDGGYTQQDVIAVARCFTGWTLRAPNENAEFIFDQRIHDPAEKRVLGKKIHSGQMRDARDVLKLLVHHPSTAKFISLKLARHFVSDTPPPALVDRMAKTFRKSDGDIRAVLWKMIDSPEFWSRDAYRAKVKGPFELVVSTARTLGADVSAPATLASWVSRIGEPLYACQPPTGYSDRSENWVNTGALLSRLNFAVALASNRVRGAHVELASLVGQDVARDPRAAIDRVVEEFLGGQVSSQTRAILEKQSTNPQVLRATLDDPVKQVDLGVVTGLVLGSPEFQRR
jgi:uncharacterized protein (DUF1800 family)